VQTVVALLEEENAIFNDGLSLSEAKMVAFGRQRAWLRGTTRRSWALVEEKEEE
jgi:hypothetical protein